MDAADISQARVVIRALVAAQEAADVARLAALGVAYGADTRHDLDATFQAQQAAHVAGMAAVTLTSAAAALEYAITESALASPPVRTNAERRADLSRLDR